jgi:branched-chain amino acid transport system ATP-binding protein
MQQPVLEIKNVSKAFGSAKIINNANLAIYPNERHAIIGPNGAGKSTMFNLISGRFAPSSGEIFLNGKKISGKSPEQINRLGLARSFQITNIFPKLSVYENLRIALLGSKGFTFSLFKSIDHLPGIAEETERLMLEVKLGHRRDVLAGELPYSEQRALEIGMTLATSPEVILLDEPMAGMSHEETDYAAKLIKEVSENKVLLVVEHDMNVIFTLCDRITVLVYGEIIATGTPDEIRNNKDVQRAYLGEEVQ